MGLKDVEKIESTVPPVEPVSGRLSNAVLRGFSAYELAVQEGFQGTLSEWLESLKGKDFEFSGFTQEQLDELSEALHLSKYPTKEYVDTSSDNVLTKSKKYTDDNVGNIEILLQTI